MPERNESAAHFFRFEIDSRASNLVDDFSRNASFRKSRLQRTLDIRVWTALLQLSSQKHVPVDFHSTQRRSAADNLIRELLRLIFGNGFFVGNDYVCSSLDRLFPIRIFRFFDRSHKLQIIVAHSPIPLSLD